MSAVLEKKPEINGSKWVALSANNKVIAEDVDPNVVIKMAEKLGVDYILQYVPAPDRSYIF